MQEEENHHDKSFWRTLNKTILTFLGLPIKPKKRIYKKSMSCPEENM